jgi:hypothetical protein
MRCYHFWDYSGHDQQTGLGAGALYQFIETVTFANAPAVM